MPTGSFLLSLLANGVLKGWNMEMSREETTKLLKKNLSDWIKKQSKDYDEVRSILSSEKSYGSLSDLEKEKLNSFFINIPFGSGAIEQVNGKAYRILYHGTRTDPINFINAAGDLVLIPTVQFGKESLRGVFLSQRLKTSWDYASRIPGDIARDYIQGAVIAIKSEGLKNYSVSREAFDEFAIFSKSNIIIPKGFYRFMFDPSLQKLREWTASRLEELQKMPSVQVMRGWIEGSVKSEIKEFNAKTENIYPIFGYFDNQTSLFDKVVREKTKGKDSGYIRSLIDEAYKGVRFGDQRWDWLYLWI